MHTLRVIAIVVVALGIVFTLYRFGFRPWERRWGATPTEVARTFPGDERVPQPTQLLTRAITIHAPVEKVWPWLVQLGQGRGGLYSYDWLENLVGCDIHSVDRIVPELQSIAVGDIIKMHKNGMPAFIVVGVEEGKWLLMAPLDPKTGKPVSLTGTDPLAAEGTWLFMLNAIDADTTRLISRTRSSWRPTVGSFLMWDVIVEPLSFVMERGMLRGIKTRAEGLK
jgi:hypothetical protein